MKEINLTNEHLELIEKCQQLRRELRPHQEIKTDSQIIKLALTVYKTYMEEALKDRI